MPIIAVIGDGQLARMMHTEAIELGLAPRVLAGSEDASAAQVFGDVRIGDYTDLDDLKAVVDGAAAATFDHEHVPNEYLDELIAAGVSVQPQPRALIYAQDKLEQRRKMKEIGAPVPEFAPIESAADAGEFFDFVSGEMCLKATRGGYDGHGVWFPDSREEAETLVTDLLDKGTPLYAERKVDFVRELSAMVARTPSGEVQAWPVVESRQRDGICVEAIAPAPGMSDENAEYCRELAVKIATELDVTGVLAVELFAAGGEITVNELAMRPHNTGHWTQDGCVTSQFEQHLRAVLDWPLGSVETTAPYTVMVNTLGADTEPSEPMEERVKEVMRRYPDAKVHLYGKGHRPGRKMGHVNIAGDDLDTVLERATAAADIIVNGAGAAE
ncbi:5-(carboxyamino)imidazole ribonucleotide synthase [Corynebacterium appendicis CIP 107643]|uniref:N5-carboxyaminoimidazole ribonucleotide synthase n=2 Tax=Corynebacterium appendicis TaxID=163202 RepID=A0A1N7K0R2_9CORY|nr:5-(carboxyamino)imidazole ribonucleotide synthase [Corynebacterium appendicis]WJY60429.1 N5-carboxyaminoimidazole ribonucleotide synthase [Corynebacterium appendicis CIP 107643]SIS55179.1 5-(carboxyamino)imidazole ribonucleotide synthase [Corynebacterium appendicis CIP 107643]